MDPQILHIGSTGPQSGKFTQGTTRTHQYLKEHSPWNIRWIEKSPTEDSSPTLTRFSLPGTGDILHAVYLIMDVRDTSAFTPIAPNLIDEVTFVGEGDILDRFTGEMIAIEHDSQRKYDIDIGRARLEGNIVGGYVNVSGEYLVDLPFWFRKNKRAGLPIKNLAETRHYFQVKTNKCSCKNSVIQYRLLFEISDLPTQDRLYLNHPGRWTLPIVTRNRMILQTEGREHITVRLPFTDELCGIMFVLRPLTDEISGNMVKFNDLSDATRTINDLSDTTLSPMYREHTGEILERAKLQIGSMVLVDRESMWWREGAWWESGRQPPNRLPFVYARYWDITDEYVSGGTHLEYVPTTSLILKLKCGAPDCSLIIWGLTRNTAEIKNNRLILHHPYNG